MMLGAGLGTAGYAFAIFHLLTHGFFKANMFLGAGSVMHGMDDDVDMRHYGVLQQGHAGHLRHLRDGLPRDHRLPRASPASGPRTRSSRSPWPTTCVVGIAALLGAGVTGFYMTRLMLMTFFSEKRWEKGVHPHESPKRDDVPLIVLAALSVLGGVLLARRLDRHTGSRPSSARRPSTSRRSRRWPSPAIAVARRGRRRRRRLRALPAPEGAARRPDRRLVRHPGRPRRALRRRDQRGPRRRPRPPPGRRPLRLRPLRRRRRSSWAGAPAVKALGGVLRKVQTGYVRSYALSVLARRRPRRPGDAGGATSDVDRPDPGARSSAPW